MHKLLKRTLKKILRNQEFYPERGSAFDFKDSSATRFGHSDVVFDVTYKKRAGVFDHDIKTREGISSSFAPRAFYSLRMF